MRDTLPTWWIIVMSTAARLNIVQTGSFNAPFADGSSTHSRMLTINIFRKGSYQAEGIPFAYPLTSENDFSRLNMPIFPPMQRREMPMPATVNAMRTRPLEPGEVKKFAEAAEAPCVSITMKTQRSGPDTRQGAVRLKNLLKVAREKLTEAGQDCSILHQIEPLATNQDFWQQQNKGLAIFLTESSCQLIELTQDVDNYVFVGDNFLLLPLIREQSASRRCLVLCITWEEASLFRFDVGSLQIVETDRLPAKYHDLILPRDAEESLQNRTYRRPGLSSGESPAMYHGQGEGEDKIKADRDRYLARIGDEVQTVTGSTDSPLVIVATSEVAGRFAAVTGIHADATIEGSTSQWSEHELQERVQEDGLERSADSEVDRIERLGAALSQDKASVATEDILEAAKIGRVEALLVCCEDVDVDVANQICCETFRQGGRVTHCNTHIPGDSGLAAFFRY
ncbi:MAG: hypothetical protein KDA94_17315 [Acidimicrobiales bacterium]|nr:hypothetical protein [Acidimicrobiales bacterium]